MTKRKKRRKPRTQVQLADVAEARLRKDKAKYESLLYKQATETALSVYKGAERSRLTKDWESQNYSADSATIDDLPTLTARARQKVRDYWAFASIVFGYQRGVVGTGLTAKSNAVNPYTGEPYEEFNEATDYHFDIWASTPRLCDTENRKTFVGSQTLAIGDLVTVGESFAVPAYIPRIDEVGLQIQMFESEQLDTSLYEAPNGNTIKGGVEVNKKGAAVAYWFFTGEHPLESYSGSSTRIPASRVIHLFQQRRIRQTRGVTAFAPILFKSHHMNNYDISQVVAAHFQACIGGSIETNPEYGSDPLSVSLPLESGNTGLDKNNAPKIQVEPGMMPRLLPNEKINWNSPQAPGDQYKDFTEKQLAEMAAGANMDYPSLTRDYSGGNFSSQRQALIVSYSVTDPLQNFLRDIWCKPIRAMFKTIGVAQGILPDPGFADPKVFRACMEGDSWQGPEKPWVDPAKQAAGKKIMLDMGLTNKRAIYNEQGQDWKEETRQIAAEKKFERELEAEFEIEMKPPANSPGNPGQPKTRGGGDNGNLSTEFLVSRIIDSALSERG